MTPMSGTEIDRLEAFEVELALGAQAREAQLAQVLKESGLRCSRRAAEPSAVLLFG